MSVNFKIGSFNIVIGRNKTGILRRRNKPKPPKYKVFLEPSNLGQLQVPNK